MKKLLLVVSVLIASLFVVPSVPVMAGTCSGGLNEEACNKICNDAYLDDAQKAAAGCDMSSDDTVINNIQKIINVAIGVVGVLAVLVIVIGGQRFITSGGDPGKVKQAKDMVLYAVVAIAVAVLSSVIILFAAGAIGK